MGSLGRKLKRRWMKQYLKTAESTISAANDGLITEKDCNNRLRNKFHSRLLTKEEIEEMKLLKKLGLDNRNKKEDEVE